MSFSLTTDQIRRREKTVTRRLGWKNLQPGTLIRAVVKCMGLRKGEAMQPLAVLCVTSVRRERLGLMVEKPFSYGQHEVAKEGFGRMVPVEFEEMFCASHKGCTPDSEVTRIEFRYVAGFDPAE